MTKKKRILIGMSGGIDSTVAAILLMEQGYELVGATFRTFDPCHNADNKGCGSEDSVMAAQELAQRLGIEHHILDFRETFRKHVITNFVEEYARGRTPNPCVMCNSHIKWGKLMQAAISAALSAFVAVTFIQHKAIYLYPLFFPMFFLILALILRKSKNNSRFLPATVV